ncbi:MAG: c-type cytochrome domain-containing protein [Puia sp.]
MLLAISVIVPGGSDIPLSTRRKPIDFTTQVKPIINKNCITCHGGVRQKGGFSLLFRDEALATLKSGKHAIIPGTLITAK